MKYDIFISYSRTDFDEVYAIKEQIESKIPEIKIWFDIDGIDSGDEFEDKIISAIDRSNIVLFALSENSINSKWTKDEVMYARNVGKKVVPVLLKDAQMKGWFLFKFGRIDCIDSTSSLQMQKLIDNLSIWSTKEIEKSEEKKPQAANSKPTTQQERLFSPISNEKETSPISNDKKQLKPANKLKTILNKRNILILTILTALSAGLITFFAISNSNKQNSPSAKASDTIYVVNDSVFDENHIFVGCYSGQMLDGKMNGRGTFVSANGCVRIGDFVDDEFVKGSMETTDHYRFEGEVQDSLAFNGIWYTPDGKFNSEVKDGVEQ